MSPLQKQSMAVRALGAAFPKEIFEEIHAMIAVWNEDPKNNNMDDVVEVGSSAEAGHAAEFVMYWAPLRLPTG